MKSAELLFKWPHRHRIHLLLPAMLILAALAHGGIFFLFSVANPPLKADGINPARVYFLGEGTHLQQHPLTQRFFPPHQNLPAGCHKPQKESCFPKALLATPLKQPRFLWVSSPMGLSHTFFPTDPQAMRAWMPKPCKLSNPSASLLRITLLWHGDLWTSNSAPALPHPLCHDSYALAMAGFHSPLHLPGRHPLHLDLLRDRTPPWRSRQAPHMDPMPSLCLPIQSQPLSTRATLPSMRRTERTPPHQNTLTNSRNFTVPLRPVTESARLSPERCSLCRPSFF